MKLRSIFALTAVLALGLGLSPARAGITFTLGNNPQPGEENVLLIKGETGTTIFGNTNQSGTTVQFSSTQTLMAVANGQARIEAINGSGDQIPLTNVAITAPGGSYGDLIFNPTITGTVGAPGPATVTVVANDGTFAFDYPGTGLGNGNNFLTITTTGGERILSTSITSPGGFSTLEQVRISGITGVPEPSSVVLMGLGTMSLVGLAWWRRRRVEA